MACGGGLYLPAVFATMLLVMALIALGMIETKLGFKPVMMTYEAQGDNADIVLENINYVMERENLQMQWVQSGRLNGMTRLVFAVDARLPRGYSSGPRTAGLSSITPHF